MGHFKPVARSPAPRNALAVPNPKTPHQRAEQALALMRDTAEDAVSIASIAGRVGIGIRCLQMAFAARYGLTPREMLTRLRLQAVRARLQSAPPVRASRRSPSKRASPI